MLNAMNPQPLLLAALFSIPQAVLAQNAFPFHPTGFSPPPQNGIGGATQFSIGSEFQSGTSCGVKGVTGVTAVAPQTNPNAGKGPGLLYAAINELGFGSASSAGPACGLCYELTPLDTNNKNAPLSDRALTFMIVDLCPSVTTGADGRPMAQPDCGVCSTTAVNSIGNTWSFDIASDAMSPAQYMKFFGGQPGDQHHTNVPKLSFKQASCDTAGVNVVPTNVNPPQASNNPGGSCFKQDGSCSPGSAAPFSCANNSNRLMAMARKRSSRYEGYAQ